MGANFEYEFMGFGAMDVNFPYEILDPGVFLIFPLLGNIWIQHPIRIRGPKPYEFTGEISIHDPNPMNS